MVHSPLLQIFFPFATTLLVGLVAHPTRHPEDVGGIDLNEVFIDVDPTGEGNKGDVLLNDRPDQVVAGGNLNRMDEEIVGWHSLPKNTWNKVFYLLKRSDTEERQTNGRIRILKKRNTYKMDGKKLQHGIYGQQLHTKLTTWTENSEFSKNRTTGMVK